MVLSFNSSLYLLFTIIVLFLIIYSHIFFILFIIIISTLSLISFFLKSKRKKIINIHLDIFLLLLAFIKCFNFIFFFLLYKMVVKFFVEKEFIFDKRIFQKKKFMSIEGFEPSPVTE